jgi:HK97 gp10 family phage protein
MRFDATAKASHNRNLQLLVRSIVVPPLAAAAKEAAQIVLQDAQAIVPVDTGELRSSGRADVREENLAVIGTVSFTAEHAGFVEYGTGLRGSGTYPGPLPQTGVPKTGKWIYDYRGRGWVGRPATPFLRPALDNNRDRIKAIFQKLLKRMAG